MLMIQGSKSLLLPVVGALAPGKSLTSHAFERLREDIITCKLRPNERLRINWMAEQYGVGPTAIREALSRLVTEGLVEAVDQKGFCVSPMSREDLVDLTETRIQVEQLALDKAVAKGDVEWEASVIAAYHRLSRSIPESMEKARAPEWRDWRELHRRFHEGLVEGCGSPWLRQICSLLYDRSERYRNLAGLAAGKVRLVKRDVMSEHKAILDALLARDADRLKDLMAQHLHATSAAVLRAAEAEPQMFASSGGEPPTAAEPKSKASARKVVQAATPRRAPSRTARR